jgi:hypothetical protein
MKAQVDLAYQNINVQILEINSQGIPFDTSRDGCGSGPEDTLGSL